MGHGGEREIVHVTTAALDQARVFEPRHCLSECIFTHISPLFIWCEKPEAVRSGLANLSNSLGAASVMVPYQAKRRISTSLIGRSVCFLAQTYRSQDAFHV